MGNKKISAIYINGKPVGEGFIVEEKKPIEKKKSIKHETLVWTGAFKLDWKPEKVLAIKQFFAEMN